MGVPFENHAHGIQAAMPPVFLAETVLSWHGLRDEERVPRPKMAPCA